MSDTAFAWLLLLVFVLTFCVTYSRVVHYLNKRFPRNGKHRYLSTGCLHGEHNYCQSNTGAAGTKIPAQCKFCETPCICDCHES